MTGSKTMPIGMGMMMGAMGLWMFHNAQTGDADSSAIGAAVFVLAHVVVVAVALLAAVLVRKGRAPWAVRFVRHRPSLGHLGVMLGTALLTALVIHLVHGGPTWT